MGKYQKIVDLIEQSVPEFSSLKLVPRGTPIFPDLLMPGQVRYARRTGSSFAVLNPDNQFTLSIPAQAEQQILTVSKLLTWLEEGALLTLNKTEMLEVSTWDPTSKQIFINQSLSASWAAGSLVSLWATPLIVHFDSAVGADQIYVRSRYSIVNGDVVTLPISGTLNSLKEFSVIKAFSAGTDLADTEFPYIYQLTLSDKVPLALTADQLSAVYLRAYPSYVSNVLNVPTLGASPLGPFLLDFVASPLDSIQSYPETFSVRTIGNGSVMVAGGNSYFDTVDHNYPVVNRQIFAENMIFWRMIRGYGGFQLPNQFRMVTTAQIGTNNYVARVSTRMVPALSPGITYNLKVLSPNSGTLIVIPYPNAAQTFQIANNVKTTCQIATSDSDQPITRLDIIFKTSVPETAVLISDMALSNDPIVQQFQYAYVFQVLGQSNFQATSIVVKPYFLSLNDLTAQYGQDQKYNAGFIYL